MNIEKNGHAFTRREFCAGVVGASAVMGGVSAYSEEEVLQSTVEIGRRIKIGVVGLGGRGSWIAKLFQAHGGYEVTAVADYFEDVVQQKGEELGVPKKNRFFGLSGYKRVLDSGVEAMILENLPYFMPEQAHAAVEAGCHVYMAKPVASDIPGVLTVRDAAEKARKEKLCFRVDYQLPTDPANQTVAEGVQAGGLERVAHICSGGGRKKPWKDPERGETIEHLLNNGQWLTSTALGGGDIVTYDIHILDGVTWVMEKHPVTAYGLARQLEIKHGDTPDCNHVLYGYEDGVIWTHMSEGLSNNCWLYNLGADIMGTRATAHIAYWGDVSIRGGKKHFVGASQKGIYQKGAEANIADFYGRVVQGDHSNDTASRAVEGTITAIMGREAAERQAVVTRKEIIKQNEKLEVDLRGLKA